MRHHQSSLKFSGSITFIADGKALANACAHWKTCELLALDTEFERARTYHPRAGLIQVCDGEAVYLIDPIALSSLDPLFEVLCEQSVLKVLHAAPEDLEVFFRLGQVLPRPLFDTQIAAPFAGYGHAPGYQRLVSRLLSVELSKAETRSNWLQRPLTRSQLIYAAQDVIHLLPLYRILRQRLTEKGREQWVAEEIEKLLDPRRFNASGDLLYQRIPHAWQLDPRGLEVLRRLCIWREKQACSRDRPRRFILQDLVLLAIARKRPTTLEALRAVHGVPAALKAHIAEALISVIQHALGAAANALPASLPNPGEIRAHAPLISNLKRIISEKAVALDLPPQVLAHNRLIESLVWRAKTSGVSALPEKLQGWRKDVVGAALLATLRQYNENAPGP